MQSPILSAITQGGRAAQQGFSAATRAATMAGNSFQKGASMALKMDQLLQEEEDRLYNKQQNAQKTLMAGMQQAKENQFKQQAQNFRESESTRLQQNWEATNKRADDQFEYTTVTAPLAAKKAANIKAKAVKAQSLIDQNQWTNEFNQKASKNYQDTMSDIFTEAESIVTDTTMTGLKKDAKVRLAEINNAAHQLGIQRGVFKSGSSNPYTSGGGSSKSGSAPANLDTYSKQHPGAPTIDNAAAANGYKSTPFGEGLEKDNAYLNRQIRTNDENGQNVANQVVLDVQNNPALAANPAYQASYASALISNGDHMSEKAWQAVNKLPPAARASIIGKAEEMVFDTTTYDPATGKMSVQVNGNGPAVVKAKARINDYNEALSVDSITTVGNYVKNMKGTSTVGGLFQDLGAFLGMGKSTSEEVNETADEMKRSDSVYLRQDNTAPYAITTSMLKDVVAPFFSKAKSFNFGVGFTGSNLDNVQSIWDMPMKTADGKQSTMERFVLPNSKESLGFDKPEYTKGRTPKPIGLVKNRSDYSMQQNYVKQMGKYDMEDKKAVVSNISNITKAIEAYQEENGYKMSDGSFKNAPSSTDMIKVPMIDLQTGKEEWVEMSLYGAVVLNSVLLQGKLQ